MSSRSKGRRAEKECKELLEKAGWLVHLVDMPHRWKKQQDIFGLFDLICISSGGRIKLIQVKSNRKPSFKPFQEFCGVYGSDFVSIEVWVRKDNQKLKDRWNTYILNEEN